VEFILHCAGALLLVAGAGWLLLSSEASGGEATGTVLVLAAVALTYVLAREITRHHAYAVPLLIVGLAAGFAYLRLDILYNRPIPAPLGYSNAAGSLFMVAAAAALLMAARAGHPGMRLAGGLAAVAFGSVPFLNQTDAATVLVALIPLALLAGTPRSVRVVVVGSGVAILLALKVVVVLAWAYSPGQVTWWRPIVDGTLSQRRLVLWNEALTFYLQNPFTGIGVRRFYDLSPTALRDRDTPWPHNEFLQFAAEAGTFGLLLIVGLFTWAALRLWWGAGDRGAAVAAAALGALGVHANVDYILQFPAIPLAAAALVGTGSTLATFQQRPAAGGARRGAAEKPRRPVDVPTGRT
jgi:O-antigen ligase